MDFVAQAYSMLNRESGSVETSSRLCCRIPKLATKAIRICLCGWRIHARGIYGDGIDAVIFGTMLLSDGRVDHDGNEAHGLSHVDCHSVSNCTTTLNQSRIQ